MTALNIAQVRQDFENGTLICRATIGKVIALAEQAVAPSDAIARLQIETSDRPYTLGESYFDIVILDRERCADGMLLFAAPVTP